MLARVALDRLIQGNARFVGCLGDSASALQGARDLALQEEHKPIAIVLGCSDARVPAELVFDQGLGDLFVIRIAGNIVAPSQIGSVEFAASLFGTRLVVVLGHSGCGAIKATIAALMQPGEQHSPSIASIVDLVRPSVQPLMHSLSGNELERAATRANVLASVAHLRDGSEILDDLAVNDGLYIVGAEYSLETGVVDFFTLRASDTA